MQPNDAKQAELAALIEKNMIEDGVKMNVIPSLDLIRASDNSIPMLSVYQPALCIVAQAGKRMLLGDNTYFYAPGQYLLVSVDLPISGQVVDVTPSKPYLSLRLNFDAAQIGEILMEANLPPLNDSLVTAQLSREQRCGNALTVSALTPSLLNAVIRMMQLLDNPEDISMLFPLVKREILYRLLTGQQGARLRQIALDNSQTHRIAMAIDWLKNNYTEHLRIEDVAKVAHMSPSGFHHYFKQVTAMTPLQYQKQLRLQEARRLMLSEDIDAATVSYRVGYESPSQFSREYSRLFGSPPLRDIAHLRDVLVYV